MHPEAPGPHTMQCTIKTPYGGIHLPQSINPRTSMLSSVAYVRQVQRHADSSWSPLPTPLLPSLLLSVPWPSPLPFGYFAFLHSLYRIDVLLVRHVVFLRQADAIHLASMTSLRGNCPASSSRASSSASTLGSSLGSCHP